MYANIQSYHSQKNVIIKHKKKTLPISDNAGIEVDEIAVNLLMIQVNKL